MEPKERYLLASFSGSKSANILDPSNGGIGKRLKIAKRRFIWTTLSKKEERIDGSKFNNLYIVAAKTAMITFVMGPASETIATSFLPSFKLKGSIGTGFAAPKITGDPESIRSRGSAILIMGSICFWGFKVRRPKSLAVGSPSLSATYPCATSCKMAEKIKITNTIMPFEKSTK